MKKCLVIELWWIGDAAMMTSVLQGLLADHWEVTVLGKSQARVLVEKSYPEVHWIEFDAPWTAFHGKYLIWQWPWRKIFRVLKQLRGEHFDASISTRKDPRDHFFFWLAGVPRRIGFNTPLSDWFLNEAVAVRPSAPHRVEDWWEVQRRLSPTAAMLFPPHLIADPETVARFRTLFNQDGRTILALHCGARIAVRRWPEQHYREVILALRGQFDFQLVLFPDEDDYGGALRDLAQHTFTKLSLVELQAVLSCASLLLANDSGPGHVADALGIPVITLFGPGDPDKMKPFAKNSLVVMRDICPYHPCSDYCRFPEPYCLTQLTPAIVLPEIRAYLREAGCLPLRAASPEYDSLGTSTPMNSDVSHGTI